MANNKSNAFESFLLGDKQEKKFGERSIAINIDTDLSVQGLERTSESVVRRCFDNLKHATTVAQLREELDRSLAMCRHLGAFNCIDVDFDAYQGKRIMVNVQCYEERPKNFNAGITMNTRTREANLSGTATIRDLVHMAEKWGMSLNVGKDWKKSLEVKGFVDVPQVFRSHEHSGNVRVETDLFTQKPMFTPHLKQRLLGFSLFAQLSKRHSLTYSYAQRKVERISTGTTDSGDGASVSSQDDVDLSGLASEYKAADTVSKILHRFENNNIKTGFVGRSPFEYMSGGRVLSITDLALFGGNTQYVLSELMLDYYLPLMKRYAIVAHMHTGIGAAMSIDDPNDDSKIGLGERFYESSRGWTKYLGDYDKATNSPLGGNVKANFIARLTFPFPLRTVYELLGLNGHAFFQMSNVDRINFKGVQLDRFTDRFWSNMYSSAGIGLWWKLAGLGRLELNYSVPVRMGERIAAEGDFKKLSVFFEMQR